MKHKIGLFILLKKCFLLNVQNYHIENATYNQKHGIRTLEGRIDEK